MRKFKIGIDILMTISILLLMGYSRIGEFNHELLGTIMIVLVITHNMCNRQFFKTIAKGHMTDYRLWNVIITCATLLSMVITIISGIMISKHIYIFFNHTNTYTWRTLHHFFGQLVYFLAALHIGVHVGIMSARKKSSMARRLIRIVIFLYGLYAFYVEMIPTLLMGSAYSSFNEGNSFLFYFHYIAMLFVFIYLGSLTTKWLIKVK